MQKLVSKGAMLRGQEESREWLQDMKTNIHQLDQDQKNYYYLMMTDVAAAKVRDVAQAHHLLSKIKSQREVLKAQTQLRKCYLHYLEGNYEEAADALQLLQITIKASQQFSSIALHFFRKIINQPMEKEEFQDVRQEFEAQYLEALQMERNNRIVEAITKHKYIVKTFSKLGGSVRYESAKHIEMLSKQSSKRTEGMEEYRKIVREGQNTLDNKNYYQQKFMFLMKIFDLIHKLEQQQNTIDYKAINELVIKNIESALANNTDHHVQMQLKQLKKKLTSPNQANQSLSYQFLGDKVLKQLKNKTSKSKPKQITLSKQKQTTLRKTQQGQLKHTFSRMKDQGQGQFDPEFRGSKMTKINYNSTGFQQRYFYVDDDFHKNYKLFYCAKQSKKSSDDDFYRLRGFKKLQLGKMSKALQREQCEEFDQERCFTLKISGEEDCERNFYVEDKETYEKWIGLFSSLTMKKSSQQSGVQHTKLFL